MINIANDNVERGLMNEITIFPGYFRGLLLLRTAFFAGLLMWLAVLSGCAAGSGPVNREIEAEYLHQSMKKLTDVIVHDIFSPPVASRVYVYPSIAAYEVIALADSNFHSLSGKLSELQPIPEPEKVEVVSFSLASLHAFLQVGKQLVFSEHMMEEFEGKLYEKIQASYGFSNQTWEESKRYGKEVAGHILAWASEDHYNQSRSYTRYIITDEEGRWVPTPPDYMDAIEPHWNKIRPFVLDSADQFVPTAPPPYDMSEGSPFYEDVIEVYETGNNLDEEEFEIANFWDCNPFVTHHQGHLMFATKKITPGGHWIGITAVASRKAEAGYALSARAYALVGIALADAFISCWDEKYRSELIRPETVIQSHIDPDWQPVLQTPPFPEYTSGHSVISASAASMLTAIYGEDFSFVDTVEVEYGLPARSFNSFREASEEAAISRLYGGIHYMPAIEYGVEQGKEVGRFVVDALIEEDAKKDS